MFPIRDINPTRITPIITIALVAANIFVFFFWQPRDDPAAETEFLYQRAAISCEVTTGDPLTVAEITNGRCSSEPSGAEVFPDKNPWLAVLVSLFLHGSVLHVLSNMWFLWIFGNNVEEAFGTLGYLLLYLVAGVAATAGFILVNPESTVPLVGASGAIAGVLGAYLVLFPTHKVLALVFVFFIPVPALLFLGIWFLGQFGVIDTGVAWEAHVAGFVFGIVATLPLRSMLLARIDALHAATRRYA